MRLLAITLLLFSAQALQAEAVKLPPHKAEYKVEASGLKVGEMKRRLYKSSEETWVLETEIYTTGFVSLFKEDRFIERSRFKMVDGHPRSLHYTYKHSNGNRDLLESLDFDWDTMQVASLRDGKTSKLKISAQVMDKLNYQVKLALDIAAGKKEMTYQVADRGDIRDYHFRVVGKERIKTSAGNYNCIKVERLSNSKSRKTFIWVATDIDFVVIQLEQDDDGTEYATYLTRLKI